MDCGQMNPMLMPLVLVQGRMARSDMQRLPPAAGPAHGMAGRPGDPLLRLAVLGESTAVGCGVATHHEGFAAAFAAELSSGPARCVSWEVVSQNGATARRIRHRLLPKVDGFLDRVVLLAGANDVLSERTPREWAENLNTIIDGLTNGAARVTVLAIPVAINSQLKMAVPVSLRIPHCDTQTPKIRQLNPFTTVML